MFLGFLQVKFPAMENGPMKAVESKTKSLHEKLFACFRQKWLLYTVIASTKSVNCWNNYETLKRNKHGKNPFSDCYLLFFMYHNPDKSGLLKSCDQYILASAEAVWLAFPSLKFSQTSTKSHSSWRPSRKTSCKNCFFPNVW